MTLDTVCSIDANDGFTYTCELIDELDQPHMNYPGFRSDIDVMFGPKMRDRIQLDIGIGDIVQPAAESLELYRCKGKPLFEDAMSLNVYPVETIFSEKLETVIAKGPANSRMKDYHDLLLLCRETGLLDPKKLNTSIIQTFENRKTEIAFPVEFPEAAWESLQKLWAAHRRSRAVDSEKMNLPKEIRDLVSEINDWLLKNDIHPQPLH